MNLNVEDYDHTRYRSQAYHYLQAVAQVFYGVLEKRVPLDRELKQYFREHTQCGARDRHFISESCFSLFRWGGWLFNHMPKGLPAAPEKSKKFCCALAAALWLEHCEDVPFFDAIADLAQIDLTYMTPAPDSLQDKIKGLGRFFKIRKLNIQQLIPQWIEPSLPVDMDCEDFILSLQKRPPVWIRVQRKAQANVKKLFEKKGIYFEQHSQCLNAIKIQSQKFNAHEFIIDQCAVFEIQDLASQCIGLVCDAKADEIWWDVCAGAGGKTLQLADQMEGRGCVIATDIRENALVALKKRAWRAGVKNVQDAFLGDICARQELFDGVLVDAPCSCSGVWRRNPDLRWTTKSDVCIASAQTQIDICQMAAKKVKMGGVFIYATCSLCVEENEELVAEFLRQYQDFELQAFGNPLNNDMTSGMLRIPFFPFDNDGMFVARMVRVK